MTEDTNYSFLEKENVLQNPDGSKKYALNEEVPASRRKSKSRRGLPFKNANIIDFDEESGYVTYRHATKGIKTRKVNDILLNQLLGV